MSLVRQVTCIRLRTGAFRFAVERPEGEIPLGRTRSRWDENIKADIQEIGWGMDWINLAQYKVKWQAVLNAVRNYSKS